MTIQFNGLSVGDSILDAQTLSKVHKERLEHDLSTHFSQITQKTPFRLRMEEGALALELNGRVVPLPKGEQVKEIGRIFHYYQHVGKLPKDQLLPAQMTKKSVKQMLQANVPGTNGSLLAGIRIADDTLALTRNILSAIPTVGSRNSVVRHLGYYAGLIWAFFSFRELDQGIANYQRAKKIEDSEGLRRARATVASGALCSGGSVAYLTGRVCETFSASAGAAATFGIASGLFGLGSILGAGASFLGAWRCKTFNDRLEEYTENKDLSQVEQYRGVLNFLKEEISVSVGEKQALLKEIEAAHPEWSGKEKEKELFQRVSHLIEKKVKYMKRRTSHRSLHLIATKADAILAKLNDPLKEKEGVGEAALLLMEVRQENNIKMSLYILGLIAGLIGIVALGIATFFTAGALPFILYGISGTIYLATTLYQSAGVFMKKGVRIPELETHPDLSTLSVS